LSKFSRGIHAHVEAELRAASQATSKGQAELAFSRLERAHVLGQASTFHHVRVHWHMFRWAVRQRNIRECAGQLFRLGGAATMTVFGLVPQGNTGGANVSPFKKMPVPLELEARIQQAGNVRK